MAEKYEWRKAEKEYYNPGKQPRLVEIPAFRFFALSGEGNPNDVFFVEYIKCLYSLSYAVKMQWKKDTAFDYAVYPLEGIWSLQTPMSFDDKALDKDHLFFDLMIRQPDFISKEFAAEITEKLKVKNTYPLLNDIKFETVSPGLCVQMLHVGSYDNEPATFAEMTSFAEKNNLSRSNFTHQEIYLSDARRVQVDKLKTILRFQVE